MAIARLSLEGGFADPVFDARSTFRALMDAMARPGTVGRVAAATTPPPPLSPVAAAVVLTLCDFDTAVWLDEKLAAAPGVAEWIRTQTGAGVAADPAQAAFAIVGEVVDMPALHHFAQGTQEYPDRSTTLVAQVPGFDGRDELILEGPGVAGRRRIAPCGLPADFVERLEGNRALFPRGVDIVLADAHGVLCVPRTTRVKRG
ncbi:MAG: phosphonate C-P lyase system protein PhnH [Rhizobiaceae bacterium]|nr:phosphonate C-P lyase system protein PhnH [Rhizobiaceae bacterium]